MKTFFTIALLCLCAIATAQCPWGGTVVATAATPASSCTSASASFCDLSDRKMIRFTNLTAGNTYTISATGRSTVNNTPAHIDYLTVYATANTSSYVAFGGGSVSFTASVSGSYDVIVNASPSQSTCFSSTLECHSAVISCNTCVPATPFSLSTLQPSTAAVTQGNANTQVLRINVNGICDNDTLRTINFTTGLTTNPNDIAKARVYYSPLPDLFYASQFGQDVISPGNTFTINGNLKLLTGAAYLWLMYDLNCNAGVGNVVDGELTSFVTSTNTITTTTGNPAGTLPVSTLYAPRFAGFTSNTEFYPGSSKAKIGYTTIAGTSVCTSPVTKVSFAVTGTSPATDISRARCYYTTTNTFDSSRIFGSPVVSPSGTISFQGSQVLASGNGNYFWLVYDLDCNAVVSHVLGATPDAIIVGGNSYQPSVTSNANATISANYYYGKGDVNGSTPVIPGSVNNQMIYGNIMKGFTSNCPGELLTNVRFAVSGTAPAQDIALAKCYFTTTTTFSTAIPFGTAIATPSAGTITFTGAQPIPSNGLGYVWLVYDMACNATSGNQVNGDIVSITINTRNYSPNTGVVAPNPIAAATSSITIASGNWNDPTIWQCGSVPNNSLAAVTINHNVSLNTAGSTSNAGNLAISSGAKLTIEALNTLTLGNTGGGNTSLTCAGTLEVKGGILNVNGSVSLSGSSTFIQSGGDINVDGNDGTAAGSVPITNNIFELLGGTVNVTGGTITLVDPHLSGNAITAGKGTFVYSGPTSGSNAIKAFGLNHLLRLGGSTGLNTSTANYGFVVATSLSIYSLFKLGNVEVNGGTANRTVYSKVLDNSSFIAGGNLVINAGCQFSDEVGAGTVALSGNVVNNGLYIARYMNLCSYTTSGGYSFNTTPQTVSGSGIFQNTATTPTATFGSLYINNTTSISWNMPVTVAGSMALIRGKISTNGNLLTLGTSTTSPGQLTHSIAGWIDGPFKRWISLQTNSCVLPVGSSDNLKLVNINFTSTPSATGSLIAKWIPGYPGYPNTYTLVQPVYSGLNYNVNDVSITGQWQIDAADGFVDNGYRATFTPYGVPDMADRSKLVLVKRAATGTDWQLDGTFIPTTQVQDAPVLSRSQLYGLGLFAIGGQRGVALPIQLLSFTGSRQANANKVQWSANCSNAPSITFIVERSSDVVSFKDIYATKVAGGQCSQPFSYVDEHPLDGNNYYRLKMIDENGSATYSSIITVRSVQKAFSITAVYPNPVGVQSFLHVNVQSANSTSAYLIVSDIQGRILQNKSIQLRSGINALTLYTGTLSSGTYNIYCISNTDKTEVKAFVK